MFATLLLLATIIGCFVAYVQSPKCEWSTPAAARRGCDFEPIERTTSGTWTCTGAQACFEWDSEPGNMVWRPELSYDRPKSEEL